VAPAGLGVTQVHNGTIVPAVPTGAPF
jgi:hypothetical protein